MEQIQMNRFVLQKWMRGIPDTTELGNLIIPGIVFDDKQSTKEASLNDLLTYEGIRYIRVFPTIIGEDICCKVHIDYVQIIELKSLITYLEQWLKSEPSEFIVLDICSVELASKLSAYINHEYVNNISKATKLGDLRGKLIIKFTCLPNVLQNISYSKFKTNPVKALEKFAEFTSIRINIANNSGLFTPIFATPDANRFSKSNSNMFLYYMLSQLENLTGTFVCNRFPESAYVFAKTFAYGPCHFNSLLIHYNYTNVK